MNQDQQRGTITTELRERLARMRMIGTGGYVDRIKNSALQEQIGMIRAGTLPEGWTKLAAAKARQYYPWKGNKQEEDLAERHYRFIEDAYHHRPEFLVEDILSHEHQ